MSVGLIMAGGAGARMRRSGATVPKPLVLVGGEPLLARSIAGLLRAGITDIVIATAAGLPEVVAFAESPCRPAVEAQGGTLRVLVEAEPMGSLGAAGLLPDCIQEVVVVNADNVSALDLGLVLATHRRRRPAMTITVRQEPFTMPFGQVSVTEGAVVDYVEKPTVTFTVCSAISVLGPEALARLRPPRFVMLPQLVNELLGQAVPVTACPDEAAWIDVNDAAGRDRADTLVAAVPGEMPSLFSPAETALWS